MPNHVESRLWVRPKPPVESMSDLEVSAFWDQFITVHPNGDLSFDFNKLIPMTGPVWKYSVGGDPEDHRRTLEFFKTLLESGESIESAIKSFDDYVEAFESLNPESHLPDLEFCLTESELESLGMVSSLNVARRLWNTKWNAYDFEYHPESRDSFQVIFDTAWCVPVPIILTLDRLASQFEFPMELYGEFGGELDDPGIFVAGEFHWNPTREFLEKLDWPHIPQFILDQEDLEAECEQERLEEAVKHECESCDSYAECHAE